jgi:predicted transglutaminase-like cysteine proteinase
MTEKNNKSFISSIRARFERNRLGELLVQRGKLTPEQLRIALNTQKETGQNIGHVVRDLNFVTMGQVRSTLFEQAAYRAIAATFTIVIGLSSFGMGSAAKASPYGAKSQFTQTSMMHKASYGGGRTTQNIKPYVSQKLFGTREVASRDISAFKKWTGILGKLENVSFNNSQTEQFKNMPLSAKVAAVNEHVNKTRYIEDKNNFGKSDYWATPAEFFARGGDCEDFAIAKYAMLKELGVLESQMRLAIVQDKIKNIPHAVLIVYTDNGPMLLDNQIKKTSQVASVDRYKPIYSINANGWWRHIT